MSKKYAEERSKKNRDYLKTILCSIRFSHAPRNIFSSKIIVTKIWSQTHKNPLKTHTEALKIQNFLGGDPLTPLTRGEVPLSWSPRSAKNSKFSRRRPPNPLDERGSPPSHGLPPLVPSALDDFLRRTTFKYAATALKRNPLFV